MLEKAKGGYTLKEREEVLSKMSGQGSDIVIIDFIYKSDTSCTCDADVKKLIEDFDSGKLIFARLKHNGSIKDVMMIQGYQYDAMDEWNYVTFNSMRGITTNSYTLYENGQVDCISKTLTVSS